MDQQQSKDQLDDIMKKMKADDIKFVRFEQTDIYGVSRSKTIPAVHFVAKATRGLPFDLGHMGFDPQGSVAPGNGFNSEIGFTDGLSFPDLDTFITIPWCKNTGRILLEPTFKGQPVAAYPRTLARQQLDHLKNMGYSLLSAHEHEFYVVDKDTLAPYTQGYSIRSTIRNYQDPEFTHQLLSDLPKVGVNVEAYESEYSPGQVEISYKPAFGIKSADIAHTFRTSVKEIALRHGYTATFMTKPWPETVTRSACHFNHSLWDVKGENSMMMDKTSPNNLSEIAQNWMAGILAHAPAISLLLAPTINCITAFKPNTFAPCNASWGIDNRTTALRVKENGESGTYIENRMSAAGGNPYLILAATVAAGIDGIQNQMELPPEVKGNAYVPQDIPPKTQNLPSDIKTALDHFTNDKVICKALGKEFCKCFGAHKLHEIAMEEEAIAKGDTEWEKNLLFEFL